MNWLAVVSQTERLRHHGNIKSVFIHTSPCWWCFTLCCSMKSEKQTFSLCDDDLYSAATTTVMIGGVQMWKYGDFRVMCLPPPPSLGSVSVWFAHQQSGKWALIVQTDGHWQTHSSFNKQISPSKASFFFFLIHLTWFQLTQVDLHTRS